MSKESEKVFKELDKFLADKNCESEDEMNKLLEQFMQQYNSSLPAKKLTARNAKTSDEYLELAESASSSKQALKYAQKALELDSDNLDAEVMIAEIKSKVPEDLIESYKSLHEKAKERMKEQGYFDDENIGEFWGILETRPYMRLLESYVNVLKECGMFRAAVSVCEEMLRLCQNDNLGMRYTLMHLYAYLEDEQGAKELQKKYPDENISQMLLPLSILYYKLGDLKTSLKYLKKLNTVNKDTFRFFESSINDKSDDLISHMNPFGYRPNTIEELVIEAQENTFLILSSPAFFEWAYRKLKTSKKSN